MSKIVEKYLEYIVAVVIGVITRNIWIAIAVLCLGLLLRLTLFKGRGSNQVNLNPQRALEGGFNPTDLLSPLIRIKSIFLALKRATDYEIGRASCRERV